MDIWSWVSSTCEELREQGQTRLADIVDEMPSLVCDGNHAQAELIAAEGIAMAKSLDHAWLELFLRHWVAQSRILHRSDVTGGMDEVIRLLDFAHSPRTQDCPQSICVTQDVCSAYEKLDGPGYAQERLQACRETLQRIDVSWPCFTCISSEYASALLQSRDASAAEAFCREQQQQLAASGQPIDAGINSYLVDALAAQGKHQEAFTLLETPPEESEQQSVHREYKLQRARLLAWAGKTDEARAIFEALPTLDPSSFVSWGRTVRALCQHGALVNDAALGMRLRNYAQTLRTNGSLYDLAWLLTTGAELAITRGAHAVADLYIAEAEIVFSKLRKPERLRIKAQRLRQAPSCAPKSVADAGTVLATLSGNPEIDIESLQAAYAAFPQHEALLVKLCENYRETGFPQLATERLRGFIQNYTPSDHDASTDALDLLLNLAVELGNAGELQTLVQRLSGPLRARALFYQAREYRQRGLWHEAVACLEQARTLEPEVTSIAKRLVFAYRQVDRWRDALVLLNSLLANSTDANDIRDHHWDRMIVATWLGEHQSVRDSATFLGFKFAGEGAIDDGYAYCDICTRDERGADKTLRAIRISPVVARVIDITGPADRERYHDEILFEPVSLNEPTTESDTGEKEEHVHEFNSIAVLREGKYRSYDLDGIHPGEEAIESLRASLKNLGAVMSIRNSERYRLTPPGEETDFPGLYAFVAVPESVDTEALFACVSTHTAKWTLPITYRVLLKELKITEELERHETLARDMNL